MLKNTDINKVEDVKVASSLMLELGELYKSSGIMEKRSLISVVFPEKFSFADGQIRTKKINEGLLAIARKSNDSKGEKAKLETLICLQSTNAPPPGLEPGTP